MGACAPFLSSSTASVIYISQVPEVDVYISISFFCIQATGNIEDHFVSPILEPRLIVFTDNGGLAQMILCAENEEIVEVPGETLVEGLIHLMASYYVFGVEYPKMCRALLFFFQDILMERPDMHGPAKSRPTRYKTFISRL